MPKFSTSIRLFQEDDEATTTLPFRKKVKHHQSEDNLDKQMDEPSAVCLTAMNHAVSMPHILNDNSMTSAGSMQNIGTPAVCPLSSPHLTFEWPSCINLSCYMLCTCSI